MGFYFVDPETYEKYKDDVLEMSHAVQINFQEHLPADKRQPGFSDKQIAKKLGIEEKVVRKFAASRKGTSIRWMNSKRRFASRKRRAASIRSRACRL